MKDSSFIEISKCPICSSDKRHKIGLRGDRPIIDLPKGKSLSPSAITISVWDCRECHHIYVDPCPSQDKLFELYGDQADVYFEHTHGADLSGFLDLLNSNTDAVGSLLDIGCGNGRILEASIGWNSVGVEPVPSFAANASEFGKVYPSLDDVNESFDAISITAVLEHVVEPFALLKRAFDLAKPGALLIIEVPNGHRIDSWILDHLLKISGRPWTVRTTPLQSPFHLSEFSRRSLIRAVRKAGWEVERVWTIKGKINYPIPELFNAIFNLIQKITAPFGWGLNITMLARRPI